MKFIENIRVMLFRVVFFLIATSSISKSSCQKDIVEELKERYYDTSTECFDAKNEAQPIYKCSGIIIRGIDLYKNVTKFAWSLKPLDKARNSFSFGFLRQDFQFTILGRGYDAGFIIYPHLSTPIGKSTPKVLCGFPADARTDARSDRGCGLMRNDVTGTSQRCDAQNITTFTQWLSHYNEIINSKIECNFIDNFEPRMVCGSDLKNWQATPDEVPGVRFDLRQCGFDLSNINAVQNFDVMREAHLYLKNDPILAYEGNELKLEAWDENDAKQIPIQAFFYFMGTEKGYESALKYQSDFYTESGGEMVPIVGIRLPTTSNPDIQIQKGYIDL